MEKKLYLKYVAANSKFPCLYCKIIKNSRGDMSKAKEFYYFSKMIRT